jgi:hypothetical protein
MTLLPPVMAAVRRAVGLSSWCPCQLMTPLAAVFTWSLKATTARQLGLGGRIRRQTWR